MAVLTLEEARADLERVASQVPEQRARALEAERQRVLAELGSMLRYTDDLIVRIHASDLHHLQEGAEVLEDVRRIRARLYGHIERLAPEEAWFWTEEWQAGERAADADIAAGRVRSFETDEAFFDYLDGLTADDAHTGS